MSSEFRDFVCDCLEDVSYQMSGDILSEGIIQATVYNAYEAYYKKNVDKYTSTYLKPLINELQLQYIKCFYSKFVQPLIVRE